MRVNPLSLNLLTSKTTRSPQATGRNTIEQLNTDFASVVHGHAGLLHQNPNAGNAVSLNHGVDNPFLSNSLPASNADGTYPVDGVSFTKEAFEQCRSVMQAAVSGVEASGTLDYINYAQMSIATNLVQSFADANLSKEQAGVLTNAVQASMSAKVSEEEALLSSGGYRRTDKGAASMYYGVQKTYSADEIKAVNSLIDAMNRVSGGNKAHVGNGFSSTTTSATNQTLIKDITNLFSNADLNNSSSVQNVITQYKSLMAPVYLANGINNTHGDLSRVLDSSAAKLTDLIDRIRTSGSHPNLNRSI